MARLILAAVFLLALASVAYSENSNRPFILSPSRPMSPNQVAPLIILNEPIKIIPREHTPLFPFLGIIPGAKQCGKI